MRACVSEEVVGMSVCFIKQFLCSYLCPRFDLSATLCNLNVCNMLLLNITKTSVC